MEQQRYFIPDVETGYKQEVTKETWERYIQLWKSFQLKLDSSTSVPVLFGTGGSMEGGNPGEFYQSPFETLSWWDSDEKGPRENSGLFVKKL